MATGYAKESRYQQLLNAVTKPAQFQYKAEDDPAFAALKKMYLREGQRASENTLAQAAAKTGGIPSSYAITAAQQAGDNYAAKLADAIPTLEQNAYQRYLNDLEQKRTALGVLADDRKTALGITGKTEGTEPTTYPDIDPITGASAEEQAQEDAINLMRQKYIDGLVTDIGDWELLVKIFGGSAADAVDVLQKKGFRYGSRNASGFGGGGGYKYRDENLVKVLN